MELPPPSLSFASPSRPLCPWARAAAVRAGFGLFWQPGCWSLCPFPAVKGKPEQNPRRRCGQVTIVEEVETTRRERLSFSGLRAPVPASELLASGILSSSQFEQLKDGKTSVKDLAELDSVRTLLQGSGCLAGIYLEESKEKVTIYEAMRRGLLRPSTAILLLEAQAATGFLVDPVRNQRLYVHEAVKAGVVGPELHEKLLSAEKAVTGYKDPYSGSTISLFQAMQKGLVLRQHGIRLLEAQIATGGIIDPVHCSRVTGGD